MPPFKTNSLEKTVKQEGIEELLLAQSFDKQIQMLESAPIVDILKENKRIYNAIKAEEETIAKEYGLSVFLDDFENYTFIEAAGEGVDQTVADGVNDAFYESKGDNVSRLAEMYYADWQDDVMTRMESGSFSREDIERLFTMTEEMDRHLTSLKQRKLKGLIQKRMSAAAFYLDEIRRSPKLHEVDNFSEMEMTRLQERAFALIDEKKIINQELKLESELTTRKETVYTKADKYIKTTTAGVLWSIGGDLVCACEERGASSEGGLGSYYVYQVMGIPCDKETYELVLTKGGGKKIDYKSYERVLPE